jgi:hypothetical protein
VASEAPLERKYSSCAQGGKNAYGFDQMSDLTMKIWFKIKCRLTKPISEIRLSYADNFYILKIVVLHLSASVVTIRLSNKFIRTD